MIKKYGNPYEVEGKYFINLEKKEIKQIIKQEVKQNELNKGTGMVVAEIKNQ